MEDALIILKPDALQKYLVPEILTMLSPQVQSFSHIRTVIPSIELIQLHYAHLSERTLKRNVAFLTSGPILVLEVKTSIGALRKLIGATDPSKADIGTIRQRFSTDSIQLAEQENRGLHNLIHCSDTSTNGLAEIATWRKYFPQ